jgi:hypothetical protein
VPAPVMMHTASFGFIDHLLVLSRALRAFTYHGACPNAGRFNAR